MALKYKFVKKKRKQNRTGVNCVLHACSVVIFSIHKPYIYVKPYGRVPYFNRTTQQKDIANIFYVLYPMVSSVPSKEELPVEPI